MICDQESNYSFNKQKKQEQEKLLIKSGQSLPLKMLFEPPTDHLEALALKAAEGNEEDEIEDDDEAPNYANVRRRKSVFAEGYNPEEDDDDEKPIIHPKTDAQRKRMMEAVKQILLFKSLESEQLNDVLNAMFQRNVEAGETVIEQGADGDNFYVIESGIYHTFIKAEEAAEEKMVFAFEGSGSFGELALMYNMPRAATIKAITPGVLWAMDRTTFRRIVLKTAFQRRKHYEQLLETVPLLTSLSSYERMNLADALASKTHKDGEVIFLQGDPGDGMYFVEEGSVDISMTGKDGIERHITRIQKGGYFGELALVTHRPRAATATVRGQVKVAALDIHAFERLLGPCMNVMKRNIDDYQDQLVRIFGSRANITEIR